jgi:glycosyltransferase involved in cell wall biosynthesis
MGIAYSVIICTHNPKPDYLRRTLESLKGQTLPVESWELLLVDNASKEPLAKSWDLSWHPHARHVREDEIGLTPARLCGIREGRGELLVFIDDDNVLAPDFLEAAAGISRRYPQLGVFGAGRLEPEFEVPPPAEVKHLLCMLALRTVVTAFWSNNPRDTACLPWGAGLCVTRETANNYTKLVEQLNIQKVLDRRGQRLFGGGDDLFSWAAAALGKGFGIFPELRITHLISQGRLQRSYFVRLIHDHQFSQAVLHHMLAGAKSKPGGLVDKARILLHGLKNGKFSMQCQWAQAKGQTAAARFISETALQPFAPTAKMIAGL